MKFYFFAEEFKYQIHNKRLEIMVLPVLHSFQEINMINAMVKKELGKQRKNSKIKSSKSLNQLLLSDTKKRVIKRNIKIFKNDDYQIAS